MNNGLGTRHATASGRRSQLSAGGSPRTFEAFDLQVPTREATMLESFSPGAYHKHLWVALVVIGAIGLFGIVLYFAISSPMPK